MDECAYCHKKIDYLGGQKEITAVLRQIIKVKKPINEKIKEVRVMIRSVEQKGEQRGKEVKFCSWSCAEKYSEENLKERTEDTLIV